LIYGYGGVKLLPRTSVLKKFNNYDKIDRPDMTTSISRNYEPIMVVSNITKFNTSEFNAWRSAFRECAKLSSKIINGQIDTDTEHRLDIWTSVGMDREYGLYAIDGAIEGKKYGLTYSDDNYMLLKINDYSWLKDRFEEKYAD
jgi:hypothetical protein